MSSGTRFFLSNRYSGRCAACRGDVDPGAGIAYQRPGARWATSHRDSGCLGAALTADELEGLEALSSGQREQPVRRELTADGRVYHPYPDAQTYPGAQALLAAFPGTGDRSRPAWDKERKCRWVSLALGDRARVVELADRLGLTVAPELRDYAGEIPTAVSERLAAADAAGAYPYQIDGIQALALNDAWLLGDDMGLGKTMQSLMAIPDGSGALLVCPKSLKRNWADECARWRPDLNPVICKATKGRDFRWPRAGEVVITHYEALPAAMTAKGTDESWWDGAATTIAIVDEAHRAKNPKAQRSKKVQALAGHCAKIWLLTGTPLLNQPFDLLGVLRAGGMDRKTFGGFRGFCRLFHASQNRWGGWEFGAVDPSVPERLRRVMLRRTKAEVLPDLPPKRRQVLLTNDIDGAVRRMLDREWREYLAEKLQKRPEDITDYEFENGVDGVDGEEDLPPFTRFSEIRANLALARIGQMVEYAEDCEEQDAPLLVFSAHRAPIDHLATREGWGVITGDTDTDERAEVVRRFQAGELKGVGLTITAGGVGLTLTRASTVLFVDLDWTPANNLQAEDRVARIGQTADSIQIVQMVTDHVLDRHVHRLIAAKMAVVEAAVERLVDYEIPADPEEPDAIDFAAARDAAAAKTTAERMSAVERRAALLDARETEKGPFFYTPGSGTSWRGVKISAEQRESLHDAWSYLLAHCDGAVEDDGQGFNRGDVSFAHVIAPVLNTELAEQVAFLTIQKYHAQVRERWPILFRWQGGADA